MLTIRNIAQSELEDFIHSKEYLEFEHIPISRRRAKSYLNNPRADEKDIILFLAYWDGKYVAYLGALPDIIFSSDKSERVAWLSCMWADKKYRRKGIALQLLKHAYKEWNGKLLITNFIPSAKGAFDKTEMFEELHSNNGVRAYLRFDLANILPRKKTSLKKIKGIIRLLDRILNLFYQTRFIFMKQKKLSGAYHSEEIRYIDNEVNKFIISKNTNTLSRREALEYNWLIKFPWVVQGKLPDDEQTKYEFTVICPKFKQTFIKVLNSENKLIAFLILTQRDNELKTPYLFFDRHETEIIYAIIIRYMMKNKICTLITYHSILAEYILNHHTPFIYKKKSVYSFLISKHLLHKIDNKEQYVFYDGDGDGLFT
jgi:GNAT superfamily N-acetyltransferase